MSGFVLKPSARRRTEPVAALPEHSDQQRERLLSNHVKQCSDLSEYVEEIGKLWGEAQEKFLIIGRYLLQAKLTLPYGQFETMVATQLPFGKNIAYQLRCIAHAVDQERLGLAEVPRSYSNAFRLAQLKPSLLERAREAKLVRPDVTRREIDEFLNVLAAEVELGQPKAERVKREVDMIRKRIVILEEDLAEARSRLTELLAHSDLPDETNSTISTPLPKLAAPLRRGKPR